MAVPFSWFVTHSLIELGRMHFLDDSAPKSKKINRLNSFPRTTACCGRKIHSPEAGHTMCNPTRQDCAATAARTIVFFSL